MSRLSPAQRRFIEIVSPFRGYTVGGFLKPGNSTKQEVDYHRRVIGSPEEFEAVLESHFEGRQIAALNYLLVGNVVWSIWIDVDKYSAHTATQLETQIRKQGLPIMVFET